MKNSLFILSIVAVITLSSCTNNTDGIKLFPIKSGDKWGYVDNKGQYIINSQFEDAFNFSEGLAVFKSTDGKYGYIDEQGKYAINPIYHDANSFSEGMACVVMENGKPQFIDKNNKIIFAVDKAEYCYGFKEGLARIKIKDKWGFIDKTGKIIINPIYENAQDFKDGLAAVSKKDDKKDEILWGYIDKSGAVKINFQFVKDKDKWFCDPGSFNEGLAFTSSNGKEWGCIDPEGKYQINPQFEGSFGNPYEFVNGVSLVSQGESYGFIDKKGKYIINPQFKNARRFSGNNLAAVKHSDDKWGFINKEGKYDINPQFEEVAVGFFGEVAFVKSSDKYGIIDEKGLYIVNPQFDDVKLYDLGENYYVKSDYVDYDGIAEMIFEKSNSSEYLGYDYNTTLSQIIDDYPDVDISDLESYSLEIKTPKILKSDIIEMGSLAFVFDEKTYTETPIYKTVRKYDSYYRQYYDAKEFVRMDKKINNDSPITYIMSQYTLQMTGQGKGKTLGEALKNQAIKKMKVAEIMDLEVKNTDFKGIYILKGEDLLVSVSYNQNEENDESKPRIIISVVNKNHDRTFDEVTESFVKAYND